MSLDTLNFLLNSEFKDVEFKNLIKINVQCACNVRAKNFNF